MTDHRHSDPVITMDGDRKDDVGTVVGEKEKLAEGQRAQAPRSLRNGGNGSIKESILAAEYDRAVLNGKLSRERGAYRGL